MDINKLPYRQKTMVIAMNNDNEFLLVSLNDYNQNEWNFPGGGLEKGETHEEGAMREFSEEIGTSQIEMLAKSRKTYSFIWSDEIIKNHRYKWKGQSVIVFIAKFLGTEKDIIIQKEEIREYKWVKKEHLKHNLIFPNQMKMVEQIFEEFPILF